MHIYICAHYCGPRPHSIPPVTHRRPCLFSALYGGGDRGSGRCWLWPSSQFPVRMPSDYLRQEASPSQAWIKVHASNMCVSLWLLIYLPSLISKKKVFLDFGGQQIRTCVWGWVREEEGKAGEGRGASKAVFRSRCTGERTNRKRGGSSISKE